MFYIRTLGIPAENPQYAIEEPIHLPNIDNIYKKFLAFILK